MNSDIGQTFSFINYFIATMSKNNLRLMNESVKIEL